mgnify:CR=1 FL=1
MHEEKIVYQNRWIDVKGALPESGQDVLIYFYDGTYEMHQIYIVTYFRQGDVMDNLVSDIDGTEAEIILDTLFNPKNAVIAPVDGFYIYENGCYRRHSDVITHWMPLPEPPYAK